MDLEHHQIPLFQIFQLQVPRRSPEDGRSISTDDRRVAAVASGAGMSVILVDLVYTDSRAMDGGWPPRARTRKSHGRASTAARTRSRVHKFATRLGLSTGNPFSFSP